MKTAPLLLWLSMFTATGLFAQVSCGTFIPEFNGKCERFRAECDSFITRMHQSNYCSALPHEYLWVFQLHFTVPVDERSRTTERNLRSWLTLDHTGSVQVTEKGCLGHRKLVTKTFQAPYLDCSIAVSNQGEPCAYADVWNGNITFPAVRTNGNELSRRYLNHNDKLVFRPVCVNGLCNAAWFGCIDSADNLRWFNVNEPNVTYSTEEVSADGWRRLMIKWYDPSE